MFVALLDVIRLYNYQNFPVRCFTQCLHAVSEMNSLPPLDNIRVMAIVWSLRKNITITGLCWIVWHNVHSQQHTNMSSSYRSNKLRLSHWNPYAVCRGGFLEYYCIIVTRWSDSGGIKPDLLRPTGFTARRYASAVLAVIVCLSVCLSVRPSVCLSATSRSCTKIAKPRITLTTPYDSPETLVFRCQKCWRNSHDITPNGGAK